MIILNEKSVCEYCFCETEEDTCPNCGYNHEKYKLDKHILPIGSVLSNRYKIGGVIGKGGFGITYYAYDLKLELKVAIKEYYPFGVAARDVVTSAVAAVDDNSDVTYKTGMEKFYEEAKLIAKFNSNPNIVSVHDFFYENDTVYYVMDLISGRNLKDFLKENSTISYEQAVYLMSEVASGLMVTHGANVLHRDVSPDNIMICDDGTIKLLDFGAARQVIMEGSQSLSVILKQGFAPFEQYQRKGKQGPWTDIYALGSTVYYAITGEMLEDPMTRFDDDEEYQSNKHNIPEDFWNIIKKATEIQSKNRYQNAKELLADLAKLDINAFSLIDNRQMKKVKPINDTFSVTSAATSEEKITQSVKDNDTAQGGTEDKTVQNVTQENVKQSASTADEVGAEPVEDYGKTMPLQEGTSVEDYGKTMPLQEDVAIEDYGKTMPLQEETVEDYGKTMPLQEETVEDYGKTMPLQEEAVPITQSTNTTESVYAVPKTNATESVYAAPKTNATESVYAAPKTNASASVYAAPASSYARSAYEKSLTASNADAQNGEKKAKKIKIWPFIVGGVAFIIILIIIIANASNGKKESANSVTDNGGYSNNDISYIDNNNDVIEPEKQPEPEKPDEREPEPEKPEPERPEKPDKSDGEADREPPAKEPEKDEPVSDNNLVYNGYFDNGDDGWELFVNESGYAQARMSVENKVLRLDVANSGDEIWEIQAMNKYTQVEYGHTYELTFDTYIEGNEASIQVAIQDDVTYWQYFSGFVYLDKEHSGVQNVYGTFTIEDEFVGNPYLILAVGNGREREVPASYGDYTIYIDNVRLIDKTNGSGYTNNWPREILPKSSTSYVYADELEQLSDEELRLAINEIYARHGYIFRDESLKEHFQQFDWYSMDVWPEKFSATCFNEYETENIKRMTAERDSR